MARTSHDKIYQEKARKGVGTKGQGTIKIRNLKAINKKKKRSKTDMVARRNSSNRRLKEMMVTIPWQLSRGRTDGKQFLRDQTDIESRSRWIYLFIQSHDIFFSLSAMQQRVYYNWRTVPKGKNFYPNTELTNQLNVSIRFYRCRPILWTFVL